MNSLTSITLDLQAPNIAVVTAGKQNDLMSRKIACQLRDGDSAFTPPGDAASMIRYAKPDGTVGFYDVLEDETTPAWSVSGSVITITLCEQMLTVPGNVWVEINFYTSTEKLTTFYFLLEVQASVLSDGTIISSDYYNVLSAQIQALLGATTNPPKIDPVTKDWLLWDENTGVYVDSGYSSVGTTGPAPELQNTEYEYANSSSGTVVPSSWSSTRPAPEQGKWCWTKTTLTFATGNTVYYTAAYQGIDGQGAPGIATPLADSGTGVVGTATAYSRQDHQHPLNVPISGTPADLGTASNGSSPNYARADHVHNSLIVASGSATSGNATWTYRRWADGMVEAWGVYSASIAVSTTGYNGYRSGEIAFPIPADVGLYNSDYVIIGQKANANEIALWNLYPSTTTAAKMYFYSGASSTNTCTVHAYLMGRWKE